MNYWKIVVNFFDEIAVYVHRDISAAQSCGCRRIIFSYSGRDHVRLGVIVIIGGQSVIELFISLVHVGEGGLSDASILTFHKSYIVAVSERDLLAVLSCDDTEGHIRVIEHLEDIVGSACYLGNLSQYVFFCRR